MASCDAFTPSDPAAALTNSDWAALSKSATLLSARVTEKSTLKVVVGAGGVASWAALAPFLLPVFGVVIDLFPSDDAISEGLFVIEDVAVVVALGVDAEDSRAASEEENEARCLVEATFRGTD